LPFNAIQQSLIALAIKGEARMPLSAIKNKNIKKTLWQD